MRYLIFGVAFVSLTVACGRGNGSTSTMSMQPVVSLVGCVASSNGAYVLTQNAPRNRTVGTTGAQGTPSAAKRYRLIDETHVGLDRYVGQEVDVTGKVEQKGEEEAAAIPALRVSQLSGRGDCSTK